MNSEKEKSTAALALAFGARALVALAMKSRDSELPLNLTGFERPGSRDLEDRDRDRVGELLDWEGAIPDKEICSRARAVACIAGRYHPDLCLVSRLPHNPHRAGGEKMEYELWCALKRAHIRVAWV